MQFMSVIPHAMPMPGRPAWDHTLSACIRVPMQISVYKSITARLNPNSAPVVYCQDYAGNVILRAEFAAPSQALTIDSRFVAIIRDHGSELPAMPGEMPVRYSEEERRSNTINVSCMPDPKCMSRVAVGAATRTNL